jgi:hypothetical protein
MPRLTPAVQPRSSALTIKFFTACGGPQFLYCFGHYALWEFPFPIPAIFASAISTPGIC